jgi:predicted nucleotidyltransferase
VFGSVARGDATVGSDVDLIATFPEHPGLAIVSIEEECEQLLGVPVHLLTFEAVEDMTNPYRRETIQRDRRTIYAYSRRRRRRAGRVVGSCAAARDADFVGPGARGG